MPQPAARLNRLPAYVFAVLNERLREMETAGVDVIRLDIGSPDMPPPDFVVEQLHQSAQNPDNHGYSGYRGIPAYREAVARYYQRRFGVTVDSDKNVLPLLGSKEGIVNLCLGYIDQGDVVLIPDIGYPSYAQGTRLAGGEIYWLPVGQSTGYKPDYDQIPEEVARQAKILWLNYPNNPTGATADLDFYRRSVEFCAQHDILLASDNPYVDVTFNDYIAPSALQVEDALDHVIEFVSLSKSHNMAGWRIGAAVGSQKALQTLLRIKSNMDSGHFIAIYEAGAAALDDTPQSWIDERNHIYQQRRDRIIARMPELGLAAETPAGSLYLWAKPLTMSANDYVEQALTDAHVSLAPGGAYGPGGNDYLRISLGMSDTRFDEALNRLKVWYASKQYA